MKKVEILRYALNIAKFMQSASELVYENQQPNYYNNLELKIMSQNEIIIELSQNRRNFKIWSPYNINYIQDLKSLIPKYCRRWDAEEKCWRININFIGNTQRLLEKYFPDIRRQYTNRALRMCEQIAYETKTTRKRSAPHKKQEKQNNPYNVLEVSENAPDEVIKAVYKAQARLHHTDLNKIEDSKMREINAAYEEIRRLRQWTSK
jgi:hypothetical protein